MSETLVFKDELTIDRISESIKEIRDAIIRCNDLIFDATNVNRIDTAAIQMLIAAKKECLKQNKKLSIKTDREIIPNFTSLIGINL